MNQPRAHVIMIDNYDSFTFNLVQYLQELKAQVTVFRNDAIDAASLVAMRPTAFVLSPGPSTPNEAGVCLELIKAAAKAKLPLLGVCLGHQAIGQALGGKVIMAELPVHGKTAAILHDNTGVFRGLPSPFEATRYHSLIVERESLPANLRVTAQLESGMIMGLRHRSAPIEGVQFHPESVLTQNGHQMLANFLEEALSLSAPPSAEHG